MSLQQKRIALNRTPAEQRAKIDRVAREHGAEGDAQQEADAMEAEGKLREKKQKADTEDARTQSEEFAAAAREHGTDRDEEAFKGVLRKLGKANR